MLESASNLMAAGDIEGACEQLADVLKRIDGSERPPDFATGEAAVELALLVWALMADLSCE